MANSWVKSKAKFDRRNFQGLARSPMGSLPEIAWPPFERRVSHVLTSHAPSTSARSSDRPQPTSVASKSGGVGSTGLTSNSR